MNSYIHGIDPFAIQIYGDIGIRWYGLSYLMGFIGGYYLLKYMAKRKVICLSVDQVGDFVTWMAISIMLGGRVGYTLFYSPSTLMEFSSQFPFWGLLEVHKGGMSSHGGMLGILVGAYLFSRKTNKNYLQLIDLVSINGGIGFFFGRIANFINGELYGRAVDSATSWSVKFPQELLYWAGYMPQKLKALYPAVETYMKTVPEQKIITQLDPGLWNTWVQGFRGAFHNKMYNLINAIIEQTQAGNEQLRQSLQQVLTARYPSQLYQSAMEGFLVFVILVAVWWKPRKPGVITGWFAILYGIMRILGEQFRMPDAHIGYELMGLTRGQWLSVVLVGIGVGILIYAVKKEGEVAGGLGPDAQR